IAGLTEAPAGIDPHEFLPELADRVFALVVGRELLANAPDWYAALESLGVIRHEDHPATADRPAFGTMRLDLAQLPAVLSHPGSVPARVDGCGKAPPAARAGVRRARRGRRRHRGAGRRSGGRPGPAGPAGHRAGLLRPGAPGSGPRPGAAPAPGGRDRPAVRPAGRRGDAPGRARRDRV